MKLLITLITNIAFFSAAAFAVGTNDLTDILNGEFDESKVPVREEPGANAETITEVIHQKEILVSGNSVTQKWTTVGYGALTHKVLIPELAQNTLFNHRNDGEQGPCLARQGVFFPWDSEYVSIPNEVSVLIQASNEYHIDRDRKICKVKLVEHVETKIDNVVFYHTRTKDMGWRFIDDCP